MIQVAVGPYKPASTFRQMVYVGPEWPRLQGCTALVADADHDERLVVAQFDRRETGFGFGWHAFREEDFEVINDEY